MNAPYFPIRSRRAQETQTINATSAFLMGLGMLALMRSNHTTTSTRTPTVKSVIGMLK